MTSQLLRHSLMVSWHKVQVEDKTIGYVAAMHLYRGTIIIIGNVGRLLLKILEALKPKNIDLGLTIANLRHCEFQSAIMASFMQILNIYGYKALHIKSDPRFHFKCDRAYRRDRICCPEGSHLFSSGMKLEKSKPLRIGRRHLCGQNWEFKILDSNEQKQKQFLTHWQKRAIFLAWSTCKDLVEADVSQHVACAQAMLYQC